MAQTLSDRLLRSVTKPLRPLSPNGSNGVKIDVIEIPVGSANDTGVLYIQIPVGARIDRVNLGHDAMGASATMDVGLYKMNTDGISFSEVLSTAFASASTLATNVQNVQAFRYDSNNIDTGNNTAWQMAGLSSIPSFGNFFVGLKFPGAVTIAGTIIVAVSYIHN